jgi:uracil-DNA glycosylase family 4
MRPEPDCRLCSLCETRTCVVFPDGDPDADIVFVGEAPGETEDREGRPFIGRAGKMLDGILAEEGLDRSSVLITNAVKCRPPRNRDPTDAEMAACRPFLQHELQGRKVVVCMGRAACRTLFGHEGRLTDIVNRPRLLGPGYGVSELIPAYHPAACVYNPSLRSSLSETVRLARRLAEAPR